MPVGAQRSAPAVMQQAGGEGSLTTMFAERERLDAARRRKAEARTRREEQPRAAAKAREKFGVEVLTQIEVESVDANGVSAAG